MAIRESTFRAVGINILVRTKRTRTPLRTVPARRVIAATMSEASCVLDADHHAHQTDLRIVDTTPTPPERQIMYSASAICWGA